MDINTRLLLFFLNRKNVLNYRPLRIHVYSKVNSLRFTLKSVKMLLLQYDLKLKWFKAAQTQTQKIHQRNKCRSVNFH